MSVVVTDTPPWVQYIATANQTVYVVPYLFFTATDLNVYSRAQGAAISDVADILTYNVNYTVTINPAPAVGGTITLNTPSNLNDIVTIYRNQPDQRLNNYQNGGPFEAPVVNPDFQQIVLMTQQNKFYDSSLAPHYNVNDTPTPVVDTILPVLPPNTSWVKNAAGTAIVAGQAANGVIVPGANGNLASFNGGAIIDSGIPATNVPRILTASIPVTTAQFKNLNAVPIQILPAAGPGKSYLIISLYMVMTYGTIIYANGSPVVLKTNILLRTVDIPAVLFYGNASTFFSAGGAVTNVPTASAGTTPITLGLNGVTDFTAGDSNFLVNVQYTIVNLT